jgi:predicted nucleotidyltransferase
MTGTEYGHVQTLYYNWLIEWDDKHEHFNDLIATAQKLAKFLGVPIELFTPKTHIGFAKEISKNFAKIPFMIY